MPFIDDSLDDVTETKPAPEAEYDLRIVKAEERNAKSGVKMIEVFIQIEDPSIEAFPIRHYLLGWDSDTPADQVKMRKLEIKRFCACFNVAEDFDADDLPGHTGRSLVTQQAGDNNMIYNRLVLPRLSD